MGFHAFPGGGPVEALLVRRCCQAPRSVPSRVCPPQRFRMGFHAFPGGGPVGLCWFDAAARPLGVCPPQRFRMGFHASPEGGLVEALQQARSRMQVGGRRQVGERRREAGEEGGRRQQCSIQNEYPTKEGWEIKTETHPPEHPPGTLERVRT